MSRKNEARDRQRPLKVLVSESERAYIVESAHYAGLSVSAYLRITGMHGRPRCKYDLEAIRDLIRVQGDLGRLGGLLKLWLVEEPDRGALVGEVQSLLGQIEGTSGILREKILAIKIP